MARHHKHFRFHNESGIARGTVLILVICFMIMSMITGYFVSEGTGVLAKSDGPLIQDVVRPGSIRAIKGAAAENQ